jgi:hypothetical protein
MAVCAIADAQLGDGFSRLTAQSFHDPDAGRVIEGGDITPSQPFRLLHAASRRVMTKYLFPQAYVAFCQFP